MKLKDLLVMIDGKTIVNIRETTKHCVGYWQGEAENAAYNVSEDRLNARVLGITTEWYKSFAQSGISIVTERPQEKPSDDYDAERSMELICICKDLEAMVNRYVKEPISITFVKINERNVTTFSDWDRERFHILTGEELYLVYRGDHLLYVVPVGADSYLTAADELMQLLAKKF